jgi:hypothetical protein
MPKATPFDTTDYLNNPEMIAAYLTEAFGSGYPLAIVRAERAVARARARGGANMKRKFSNKHMHAHLVPWFHSRWTTWHPWPLEDMKPKPRLRPWTGSMKYSPLNRRRKPKQIPSSPMTRPSR